MIGTSSLRPNSSCSLSIHNPCLSPGASSSAASEDEFDYAERPPSDHRSPAQYAELALSRNSLNARNVRFQMPAHVIDDTDRRCDSPAPSAEPPPDKTRRSRCCRPAAWCGWLVRQFDLDLLADRRFVNIVGGMAIATFAEINFSVLMPFVLNEMGYGSGQTAGMLSTLAGADIAARFVAPFVGDWCGGSSRVMYMAALAALVVTRGALLAVGTYAELLAVAAAMGAAKGVRTVYMILVIPDNVPIERLPSAGGIRMVANACVLLVLGPFVGEFAHSWIAEPNSDPCRAGYIRDLTGDYVLCIVFMNAITCLSLAMWSAEMLYTAYGRRRARIVPAASDECAKLSGLA